MISLLKIWRTLKAQYVEIKKAKELSDARWDDLTETITLDPIVAFIYTKVRCLYVFEHLQLLAKIYICMFVLISD